MKFRLLDLHQSGREDLPRILLYSVILHYLILYFMLGNPFLILLNRDRGTGRAALNVDLVTSSQVESDPKKKEAEKEDRYPIVFRRENGTDDEDQVENKKADTDPLTADGMNLVEANVPISSEKKKVRKPPPNMTGPQDCMLKLVGQVCPTGDFQCIEAYKDFCENLPN